MLRYDQFRKTDDIIIIPNEEPEQADLSDDEEGSQSFNDELTSDDESFLNDDEMFAIPGSTNINYDSNQDNTNMDIDNLWIFFWIFKYQKKFRLSDIAINLLIGFFSLVLKDIDLNQFKDFPPTAYKAKKLLEIKKLTKTFTTCPHCNKLYNIDSIIPKNQNNNTNSEFKCTYTEFPNYLIQNQRKSYRTELLVKVPVNYGYI
ncbi:13903_t:CDS:2 [Funneliformis caledonium]|uniref:13903_t:CDS:1 n=1 Tax=Funneliformis caledonium TaxID=1117310 RepID=A0A9N9GSM9_9GLOM|nr:13903_t:CDS:2 [Funneliformis caledonium]